MAALVTANPFPWPGFIQTEPQERLGQDDAGWDEDEEIRAPEPPKDPSKANREQTFTRTGTGSGCSTKYLHFWELPFSPNSLLAVLTWEKGRWKAGNAGKDGMQGRMECRELLGWGVWPGWSLQTQPCLLLPCHQASREGPWKNSCQDKFSKPWCYKDQQRKSPVFL